MPDRTPAARTFAILSLAAAGMAALLALLPATGHDQMWLLYAARLWMHGAKLYGPEIFETNPPLILWLSAVPAWLSGWMHLPDTAVGKCLVIALESAIAVISLRLYRLTRPQASRASLFSLAFSFIAIFAALPARDFGQRDHLLALLLFPYVISAAVRARSILIPDGLAWGIGVLALAGLALKPHQLIVPLTVEFALLATRRTGRTLLRPELLAMLASGLLFLAAVGMFAPSYFSVVGPLARDTYWAFGQRTFPQLVGDSVQLHLLLLFDLAMIAVAGWRATDPLARLLLVAGVAATCAYYLQGTGWYYQQLPALTFLGFAAAVLLLDRLEPINFPSWTPKAAAALAVLALALTTHFMNYPFTAARSFPVDTPAPELFAGVSPGDAVMTISPTVDHTIPPIYKYRLVLGERYSAFVMLPALLRMDDPRGKPIPRHLSPERVAELNRLQHEYMIEDLHRWQPRLILVERCQDPAVACQVLEDRHDDLLAYFLRDPAFGVIFASYRYVRSAGAYDAYLLAAGR